MSLIYRYIFKQLFVTSCFALVALLGVYAFFDIVEEVSRVGKGDYTTWVMLQYIFLLIPSHAYELMPLAVLIGGMITMNLLSSHSEYMVVRTSGISIYQIGGVLIKFGVAFAVIAVLLGEMIMPSVQEYANKLKLTASNQDIKAERKSSGWVKNDNRLINIGALKTDGRAEDIKVYQYDNQYKLQESLYAGSGVYKSEGVWELDSVRLTKFTPEKTRVEFHDKYIWHSILEPKVLDVLLVVPEQMSAYNLVYYIGHLKDNHQQTRRYEIALWGKLFYPLACVSMALIALAFTPRQRRQGALGVRLFLGICLGVGFHFFNRFCGYLGLLYSWNPVLVSTLPTLIFLCGGLYVIRKQEKV